MTNPTIDGVEIASQADLVSLQAHLAALDAHPSVPSADVQAVKDAVAALQAELAADESASLHDHQGIADLTAKIAALSVPAAAPPPSGQSLLAALIAALTGTAPITPAATVPGTTTSNPAVVDVNYFPANAADAPSPSPEDSKVKVIGGKLSSIPYLVDAQGAVFKFDRDANGDPNPYTGSAAQGGGSAGGYQFSVNGTIACFGAVQITVRQHQCWVMTSDGVTRGFERQDNPNAGTTVVQLPPIATAAPSTAGGTTSAPASAVPANPTPNPIAPGSSGKIISATVGGLATAIASASAGDTVKADPSVYNESVGISVPLLIEGGGKTVNPGLKTATYQTGATLDATGVGHYVQGQGGFVALADCWIRGWTIKKFGADELQHGGTGGFRNNAGGVFTIEDCAFYQNQMGIGPHGGDAQLMIVKNCVFVDCGLPQDDGYAHNIYSEATEFQGSGITSIENAGGGGGHAIKARTPKFSLSGNNYCYASESSCIDLSDGTAAPFSISGGTVLEKKAGDVNTVIFGYGAESVNYGNVGGKFEPGATFIIPNDGRNYIFLTSGNIDVTGCKFLFTDGSPVKAGTITVQSGANGLAGTVTGLP